MGYSSLGTEIGGTVVTSMGIIAGGVGTASNRSKMSIRQQRGEAKRKQKRDIEV